MEDLFTIPAHNKFLHFPPLYLKGHQGKQSFLSKISSISNMAHFTQAKSGAVQICLKIKRKNHFNQSFVRGGGGAGFGGGGSSFQIFQMGFCRKCVTFGNHYMSVKDCSHASSGKTLAQFLAFASMSRKKEN